MSDIEETAKISRTELIEMTTEVVTAYVGAHRIGADEIQGIIESVFYALSSAVVPVRGAFLDHVPAVSIKKSKALDHLVCLECGAKLKTLKRHLSTSHSMSVEEYRAKWSLPADYPAVAPSYAAKRSNLAKKSGLGTKPRKASHSNSEV